VSAQKRGAPYRGRNPNPRQGAQDQRKAGAPRSHGERSVRHCVLRSSLSARLILAVFGIRSYRRLLVVRFVARLFTAKTWRVISDLK